MAGSAPTASAAITVSPTTLTLTVNHTDADRQTITVAGTVTDSQGNVGNWSASAVIDGGAVAITQAGGKVWTLQSATRDQTIFTAPV